MKAKTLLVLLAVSALLLGVFFACASTPSGPAPIGNASGTATGTAKGYENKEITVTITMVDGFITDVVITGQQTAGFGENAIMRAPAIIKRNNNPKIDTISSATFTSVAISEAAQSAVDQIVKGQ